MRRSATADAICAGECGGGASRAVAPQPPAQRCEVKARTPRVEDEPGGRTHQHAPDDRRGIPVLAEDVADARTVTRTDRGEIDVLGRVLDDERGVVLDARACLECADQIVDLLAGRRRQPEPLVEGADSLDYLPAEEDRERDGAIPEIVGREDGRLGAPPWLAAREPVEIGPEPAGDALEQIVGIDA